MVVYGWGLWTRAIWAIPLGALYAGFATANLLLFPVFNTMPERIPMWAYAIYVVVGSRCRGVRCGCSCVSGRLELEPRD
jgi:hypothetical protein